MPIDPRLLAAATILAILPHAAASLAMPSARSLFPAFPWCLAILGSIGGLAALLGAAASRSDSGRLSFLGAALAAGASAMYWLGAGFYDAALQGAAPPWLGNIGVWLFLLPLMLTLGLYPIGIAIVALVSAGGAFVVVVRGDRGRAS